MKKHDPDNDPLAAQHDENETDPLRSYQTSAFTTGGLLESWVGATRNVAERCLRLVYDDGDVYEGCEIIDMDDCFENERAARGYLSTSSAIDVWVEPPHGTYELTWTATPRDTGDDAWFRDVTIECEAWCTCFDAYVMSVSVTATFDRITETIALYDPPVIVIQDATQAV